MNRFVQLLVCTSLLATMASSLRVYPHQLAYFNELAGGPENGWRHLLGSNFDWGQDLLACRDACVSEGRALVCYLGDPPYPVDSLLSGWLRIHEESVHELPADCVLLAGISWLVRRKSPLKRAVGGQLIHVNTSCPTHVRLQRTKPVERCESKCD